MSCSSDQPRILNRSILRAPDRAARHCRLEGASANSPRHDAPHPQLADETARRLRADRAGPGGHVCVRHDDLRPVPHGPCADDDGLRRRLPLAAHAGLRRDLRAQHHRHRRQDHQACGRARHHDPCADRRDDRRDAPRHRRAGHRAPHARAARDRPRGRHARHHRHARSQRPGLSGERWRRELPGAALCGLRQAVGQVARRAARRRARGGRHRASKTRSTSCCGRPPSPKSLPMRGTPAATARGAPAGTSNARR